MLSGYKTYISVILGVLWAGAHVMWPKLISDSVYQTGLVVIGGGAIAALRAAIAKVNN